ncbi:hypothetical protein QBC39DRAFT_134304 [Podospora conica]|nr:hypothetical protein QBC39DRAFT_134304 [Schizothecium conicum]
MEREDVWEPSISDPEVRQVLAASLDGFLFSPDTGETELTRGLLEYNDFASCCFHKDDDSVVEYTARFKKNLSLFFRALHFFEEFYSYRGFTNPAGFWGIMQQELWFLFETPKRLIGFLWLLINARNLFDRTHPGHPSHFALGSDFPQCIQRLVLHWSFTIKSLKGQRPHIRPNFSPQDATRLRDRRYEFKALLATKHFADHTDLRDILGGLNISQAASNPASLDRPLDVTTHRARAGAEDLLVKQETPEEFSGIKTPIGETKKRKKRSSGLDSSQAGEPGAGRKNKRLRHVSPPEERQATSEAGANTPRPENLSSQSDGRVTGLDKRLNHTNTMQLQHGLDISSLNSRLESQASQHAADMVAMRSQYAADMAAMRSEMKTMRSEMKTTRAQMDTMRSRAKKMRSTMNKLQKTTSSNTAELSALRKTVKTFTVEERIQVLDREQLEEITVEALQTLDLQNQPGYQPNDIPDRVQAIEDQLKIQRFPSMFSTPQQLQPPKPAELFDSSHDLLFKPHENLVIQTMAEKVETLQREVDQARALGFQNTKASGPPATQSSSSRSRKRGQGGTMSLPIKLEDSP